MRDRLHLVYCVYQDKNRSSTGGDSSLQVLGEFAAFGVHVKGVSDAVDLAAKWLRRQQLYEKRTDEPASDSPQR